MKQRSLFILTTLAAVSLVLSVACNREQPDENWLGTSTDPTATATASATHPGSPGGTALVPEVASGTTLIVVLGDGSIGVQDESIPPGPAILTVENRGTQLHNLFIEGEQINRAAGDPIAAGGSSTVDVMLRPGTYTLYCPVLDHRQKGEEKQITVSQP